MTKPQTNLSAEEPQIPNKMELIKLPTDMITLVHEKTFRDLGSGFVIMKAFIDWHKKYIEWWKKKLKISNYGIVWISFIKGLIIGLLIYHFFIN